MGNFNSEKMFTYVKGYAMGARYMETLRALTFARESHKGQLRKGGEPYIVHPLTMTCNAIAVGIEDDNTLAVILLHDVVEDCGVSINDLPVNDIVKKGVKAMTFKILKGESKEEAKARYYREMLESKEGALTKLIDRCHNVSTMAGVFTREKLEDYIKETREYVLPLLRQVKETNPEMSNTLFLLKYHITSVVNAIEAALESEEEKTNVHVK